jgi:hypothetical protein
MGMYKVPPREYNIPFQSGGNSKENVKALEDRVEEIKHRNGHLDIDEIERMAIGQLFHKEVRLGGS